MREIRTSGLTRGRAAASVPPLLYSTVNSLPALGSFGPGVTIEQAPGLQPRDTAIGPRRARLVAFANAESVAALGVKVQLCRHVRPLEGHVHHHTVLNAGHRIVARMHKENRGRLLRNPHVRRQHLFVYLGPRGT